MMNIGASEIILAVIKEMISWRHPFRIAKNYQLNFEVIFWILTKTLDLKNTKTHWKQTQNIESMKRFVKKLDFFNFSHC